LNAELQSQFTRLSRETGAARTKLIRDILGSMNGALGLCDVISRIDANDAASPALALRDEAAAIAATHTNALVRDLFQRFLPPGDRRATLGAEIDPRTILALKGDAGRGKSIFTGTSQCARCHVCGGEGRAFGPGLDAIGRKYSRAQVLEHILLPSRLVAPEFKTAMVTLRDDTELSGFVQRQTADEFVLRDESLAEHRIKRSQVKEFRESTLSAMPEGLLAPLTAQEAADLLEYICTTTPPK
jgi:putative heme-binding domain-containing protein